jgi:hypothetical protein
MVYSLTCNVSKRVGGLINSPTAVWTTEGVAVTNGNGINISDTTGDATVTSTLTFNPLQTSHEGSFVCSGTLTSPALDTALMPSATEELEIQSKIIIYRVHRSFCQEEIFIPRTCARGKAISSVRRLVCGLKNCQTWRCKCLSDS